MAPAAVMPIVKANAYGHGLVAVARHLVALGAASLGVAFLEEAVALREAGVAVPILVMGGIFGDQIPLFLRHGLTLTASSVDKLRHIDETAAALGVTAKVHLKIDTGMERIGIHYYNAEKLLERAAAVPVLRRRGDLLALRERRRGRPELRASCSSERFLEVLTFYDRTACRRPCVTWPTRARILQLPREPPRSRPPGHPASTASTLRRMRRADDRGASRRCRGSRRVVYFKVVLPGHPVSYGSTWQSDHPVRVVTVPGGLRGRLLPRAVERGPGDHRAGSGIPWSAACAWTRSWSTSSRGSAYNGDEVILIGERATRVTCEDLAEWPARSPTRS